MNNKTRRKPFVRGDRITFRLNLDSSDNLMEWINNIKLGKIGPEIANILEQYTNRELIHVTAFKELYSSEKKTTIDTNSLENAKDKITDSEDIKEKVAEKRIETKGSSISKVNTKEDINEPLLNDIEQTKEDLASIEKSTDNFETNLVKAQEDVSTEKPINNTKKKPNVNFGSLVTVADKMKAKSIFPGDNE